MASHGISWVLGAHVRFGNLDFIITVGGELVLVHAAIQSSTAAVGVSNKHQLVNLYLLRVRLGWCTK